MSEVTLFQAGVNTLPGTIRLCSLDRDNENSYIYRYTPIYINK